MQAIRPCGGRAVSAAKVQVGRAARHVGEDAIQLHGGIAMTDEYAAGHYFKRLTMIRLMFGDEEYHLRRYRARAARRPSAARRCGPANPTGRPIRHRGRRDGERAAGHFQRRDVGADQRARRLEAPAVEDALGGVDT